MTPTNLNIWTLGRLADGRREFPNRISPPDAPHLRRCIAAGLLEVVDRATLRLTDAGVKAVNAEESVRFVSVEDDTAAQSAQRRRGEA